MYVYERVCKFMRLCRIYMLDLVDAVRVILLCIEGRLSKVWGGGGGGGGGAVLKAVSVCDCRALITEKLFELSFRYFFYFLLDVQILYLVTLFWK